MSQEERGSRKFDIVEDSFRWTEENSNPSRLVRYLRIAKPNVTQAETIYDGKQGRPLVQFKPADTVLIKKAGGCVQTGGTGSTWKRYVDPKSDEDLYYGQIKIPGAMDQLRRIKDVEGQFFKIPETADPSTLFLTLGYEDDDYADNGYWGKDDGTEGQCSGEGSAFIELEVPARPQGVIKRNRILDMHGSGPAINPDESWARNISDGTTFMDVPGPHFQWLQVGQYPLHELEDTMAGLSATAIRPRVSSSDVPFTHPFGNDWEVFLVPDERFLGYLAPSNKRSPIGNAEGDYEDAVNHARHFDELKEIDGVLGVEVDSEIVPNDFRTREGDRVAIYGKWIVDAGHDDFHTEIHPPFLLANARTDEDETRTECTVWTRPFMVSQIFNGAGLLAHLIFEVGKTLTPIIPLSLQAEAHPSLLKKPFRGEHELTWILRPPFACEQVRSRFTGEPKLFVSYRFVCRTGVGVILRGLGDELHLAVRINEDEYIQPDPPVAENRIYEANDIGTLSPEAGERVGEIDDKWWKELLTALQITTWLGLLRGNWPDISIETHEYQNTWKQWPDIEQIPPTVADISSLNGQPIQINVDNSQPFPILGKLTLWWRTSIDDHN